MHEKIPDFNDTELWVIRQAVTERFRKQADHAAKRAADPNI